jgi:hypothetical protein
MVALAATKNSQTFIEDIVYIPLFSQYKLRERT